jgi:hypothetical protein
MKPIILTYHAAVERMGELKLEREWVEQAIRTPDWTEPDPRPGIERRFRATPEYGGRVLRVACVEEKDHIRVVSVFPDRNATRRHARKNIS